MIWDVNGGESVFKLFISMDKELEWHYKCNPQFFISFFYVFQCFVCIIVSIYRWGDKLKKIKTHNTVFPKDIPCLWNSDDDG